MIGEEIVGVSLVWRFEVKVDGHCWVSRGVVVHGWAKYEVVGHCLVMCVGLLVILWRWLWLLGVGRRRRGK